MLPPGMWPVNHIAFLRTFTDIDYAAEIWAEVSGGILADLSTRHLAIAPRFELRFKSLTKLVCQQPQKQVLEIAAGLSPRGLILTEDDPAAIYIETDRPAEIETKRRCVENVLIKRRSVRPNLIFAAANALSYEQLVNAALELGGPITILNEGLFSTQPQEYKQQIAANIHKLLSIKAGGVWITPDIATRQETLQSMGGEIPYGESLAFENEAAIDAFLAESGFRPEKVLQRELVALGELESIKRLRLDEDDQARRLADRRIYCLYPQ